VESGELGQCKYYGTGWKTGAELPAGKMMGRHRVQTGSGTPLSLLSNG